MIRKASLLVLLALAAAPSMAHADAKAKVEARARMDKATELYGQGKYAEALNELTIAYTLDPRPETLYAIGQMHVQLGNCPQAILFYERFLTTNPDSVPAAAAQEAIDTCKHKPDAVLKPDPAPQPAPVPQPPPPAPPAWYTDKLGIVLAGGGVVLGVAGLVTYAAARSDLDKAEDATNYQSHADLVDSAHSKRTIAAVLGAVGVGLVGAGVTRFVLVRRASASASVSTTVGIAPAPSGGLVTWSGRF
jgi:tetratricopeptide (TPR) repeat protein